jgi:hypothetical protein
MNAERTRLGNNIFSRKSEKIGSDPTFVLTLLFASKYSYLAESIAIKQSILQAVAV